MTIFILVSTMGDTGDVILNEDLDDYRDYFDDNDEETTSHSEV